jgi:hypothetical protein
VEVRRWVVVEVHRDDDPVESGDPWHTVDGTRLGVTVRPASMTSGPSLVPTWPRTDRAAGGCVRHGSARLTAGDIGHLVQSNIARRGAQDAGSRSGRGVDPAC